MSITILTEAEIRECVDLDRVAFNAVADGFSAMTQGRVTVPPIVRIDIPEHSGEVDIKTAYIHGLDSFAIKIASGFFENYRLGLPTGSGMMVVVSTQTGFPKAILLDNGYLTDLRTAIAGGLAAQYLAPSTIEKAGVIGTGMQARWQMRALHEVRPFKQLYIYGIIPEEVERYAREMAPLLEVETVICPDPKAVVTNAEVVVTCTPSHQPFLRSEWLHPRLHITAMGSDSEEKQELFPQVLARADLLACDRKIQSFRLGELHHGLQAGAISQDSPVVELGELTSGRSLGRRSDEQITVCDLSGVGVQDTAIANLTCRIAQKKGMGFTI